MVTSILAIMGSPRKGETYSAVQRFEEELLRFEEINMEYVMFSKLGVADCLGCHNCITKGENFCHQAAKVKELQDKMLAADGVILATPVYNQHVTAIMKKFLDYFTFLWHRPAMFGVKFIGISSGGGMFTPVFKFLKMNAKNWGGIWVDGLGVPHYESLTDKYRQKIDGDFTKKAQRFIAAIKDKKLPNPSLGQLLWFNMWKINAVVGKDQGIKDFEHWTRTNWFTMDYYYPAKVGYIKKWLIRVISKLMRSFMRKMYKGY